MAPRWQVTCLPPSRHRPLLPSPAPLSPQSCTAVSMEMPLCLLPGLPRVRTASLRRWDSCSQRPLTARPHSHHRFPSTSCRRAGGRARLGPVVPLGLAPEQTRGLSPPVAFIPQQRAWTKAPHGPLCWPGEPRLWEGSPDHWAVGTGTWLAPVGLHSAAAPCASLTQCPSGEGGTGGVALLAWASLWACEHAVLGALALAASALLQAPLQTVVPGLQGPSSTEAPALLLGTAPALHRLF